MLSENESTTAGDDAEVCVACSVLQQEQVPVALAKPGVSSVVLNSSRIQNTELKLSSLQTLIDTENWSHLAEFLERFPSLAHASVTIIVHGERTPCLPLHAVCAQRLPSLDLLEQLIAFYPSALQEGDHRMRLPLHLALLRGCTSKSVIRYLCDCSPRALLHQDQDRNLPFHYACQFSSSEIIQFILNVCPEAAMMANEKKRFPLHLVCSRNWDLDGPCVRSVLEAYPEAVQECDRCSRLPLHWACDQSLLRYDVLATLVKQFPSGLLHRDNTSATPVQLAKRMQLPAEQGVVIAFLKERTAQERRNKSAIQNFFTIRFNEKNNKNTVQTQFPYG